MLVAVAGGRGLFVPVVVVELTLGVLIGPQLLDLAKVNAFTEFFGDLGLGMLFFFAGYEIDLARIRGMPLRLGLLGWAMSLAIAYSLGGLLALAGVVISLVYVGSALATTAIGTLLPVLSDTGEMRSRFGTYLLAAGAVGEFGPILLLTLVLSTQSALHNALILVAFVLVAVAVAVVAVRSSGHTLALFERTLESSSQLAVRWFVVLVFALALLANKLGLDLLLGGFAAGLITRQVLQKSEIEVFDSKLNAVAFGFFVPFFFVVSGLRLDVDALFSSVSSVAKLLLFFVLFLVVRGTPAMLLYRGVLPLREDRMALALFSSTQLPLVVAITTLAVREGHMRSSTAAALVGAGALSTLAGPLHGLRMRRIAAEKRAAGGVVEEGALPRRGAGHAMSAAGRPGQRQAALDPAVGALPSANAVPLDQLSASERSASWRTRFLLREWVAGSLFVIPTLYMAVALALAEILARIEGSRDVLSLNFENDTARTFYSAVAGGMIAFTGSWFDRRRRRAVRREPVHAASRLALPSRPDRQARARRVHRAGDLLARVAGQHRAQRRDRRPERGHHGGPRAAPRSGARVLRAGRPPARPAAPAPHRGADRRPRRESDPRGLSLRAARRAAAGGRAAPAGHDRGPPRGPPRRRVRARSRAPRAGRDGGRSRDRGSLRHRRHVPTGADLFAIRGAAEARGPRRAEEGGDPGGGADDHAGPGLSLRAIVDIALRALSPAVNDPTTAVQALDGIDTLLMEFAARDLERGRITSEDGALRLVYPNMVLGDLLDLSLTEIRHYGADTPQIARRMRALLLGLAEQAPAARRGRRQPPRTARRRGVRATPTPRSARTPRP